MGTEAQASTSPVADVPLTPHFGWGWWITLLVSGALVVLLGYTLLSVVFIGVDRLNARAEKKLAERLARLGE